LRKKSQLLRRREKAARTRREDLTTGLLDDVLGSGVPKGSLAKPLLIALGALLSSGALHKGTFANSTGGPTTPAGGTEGGLLGDSGVYCNDFSKTDSGM
jgi:hypothetical protein